MAPNPNKVLEHLCKLASEGAESPTAAEIGDALGLTNSCAYDCIAELIKRGTVRRHGSWRHGIPVIYEIPGEGLATAPRRKSIRYKNPSVPPLRVFWAEIPRERRDAERQAWNALCYEDDPRAVLGDRLGRMPVVDNSMHVPSASSVVGGSDGG